MRHVAAENEIEDYQRQYNQKYFDAAPWKMQKRKIVQQIFVDV